MDIFRTKARARIGHRILWSVIGVVAALQLTAVVPDSRSGFPLSRVVLVSGTALAALTFLGLLLRWGPLVPCMFLGMFVSLLLTSPVDHGHSAVESTFNFLGIPLIGAICGAIVGFCFESQHPHGSEPKQHED